MRIEVSSSGVDLPESLRVHSERTIRSALRGHHGRITHVQVAFASPARVREAIEVECRIRIAIVGRRNLSESRRSSNAYAALDEAASRLSRSLDSKQGRNRKSAH